MGQTVLGIDGGGSGTQWALFGEDGAAQQWGAQGPLTGHLLSAPDRAAAQTVLDALITALQARPDAVVAGVAGLLDGSGAWLREALAARLVLDPARIRIVDDLELAYAAQFAPGEGVLVYAGTGSLAIHVAADGTVIRAGGHGYLLGDEGGAYWQGQQALRALLHAQDAGQTLRGPLAGELEAVVGGLSWPAVRQWVYGGGRSTVARLAPGVDRAAQAGDPAALDITVRAGQALARLARLVLDRCPAGRPLVVCGGAANPGVRAALCAALPGVPQRAARSPLRGAVYLAPRPPDASP